MNGKSILILLFSILSQNVVHQFRPSIAYHPGSSIMYNTNHGWVRNGNISVRNANEILKICQIIYPEYHIINVMKVFQTETITNWCPISHNCTRNMSYDVHPFRCLNSTFNKELFNVSKNCIQGLESHSNCYSFDDWKNVSMTFCSASYSYVMNMIQFSPCKNTMMFSNVDIVCCPADESYYKNLFNTHLNLNHNERLVFSQLRHALLLLYSAKLKDLESDLCNKRYLNFGRQDRSFKANLENLKLEFKRNLTGQKKWFTGEYLKIERTHIQRIFDKVNKSCKNLTTLHNRNACVKQLNLTLIQLENHYKRTPYIHFKAYNQYLIGEFELLFKNYSIIFERENLTKKLQSIKKYLHNIRKNFTMEDLFDQKFNQYISKCNDRNKSEEPSSHSHTTPVMSIVVTTVILLIIIILTFIGTIVIKFCGQPFRRSSPNYVMSVVFDANQTQGPIPRSDQNLSENSKQQNVKLNLYENPIFNPKSAVKPIEKQSLIENMES